MLKQYVIGHIYEITIIFVMVIGKGRKTILIEAFYILFFCFMGESISYFIGSFIPSSTIRIVLLSLTLALKRVRPEKMKHPSTVLTQNTRLFFAPADIGPMNSFGIVSEYQAVLPIASVVSIVLVIANIVSVQQKLEKGK